MTSPTHIEVEDSNGGEQQSRSVRRTLLQAGTVLAAATAIGGFGTGTALAAGRLPYPDITDTTHASDKVARILRGFFSAKSRHDPDTMMTYFSKTNAFYIDASSGNVWPSWDSLNQVFHAFLPSAPPTALSYPVRIVGDERSAMVEFEDTPQLFGKELRIIGSVTFDRHGKIVRWIDYWDGRSSDRATAIASTYPTDFHDSVHNASPLARGVASRLQSAFASGDATAATELFSFDAVFEDTAAHTRIRGQLQIGRYLTRALPLVPYGPGRDRRACRGQRPGRWVRVARRAPGRPDAPRAHCHRDRPQRRGVPADDGVRQRTAQLSAVPRPCPAGGRGADVAPRRAGLRRGRSGARRAASSGPVIADHPGPPPTAPDHPRSGSRVVLVALAAVEAATSARDR